jgi:cell wall-associated NlpC family hydrolase
MKESGRMFRWMLLAVFLAALSGCGGGAVRTSLPVAVPAAKAPVRELAEVGYSVQAGVFANLENAVRLMERLDAMGLEAYYYRHADGLFKVRFGDYPSAKAARMRALLLRNKGHIDDFEVVAPNDHAAVGLRQYPQSAALREMLVGTAMEFIGIPYRWGGESAEEGFDCSGLAMTVYKMNGLNLPRSSRDQFAAGSPVPREALRPGDLVFFATAGDQRVSHVGIYAGNGSFIHAPSEGKAIQQTSLRDSYYQGVFLGARTYLRRDS